MIENKRLGPILIEKKADFFSTLVPVAKPSARHEHQRLDAR